VRQKLSSLCILYFVKKKASLHVPGTVNRIAVVLAWAFGPRG
jgi:hypothetical protein